MSEGPTVHSGTKSASSTELAKRVKSILAIRKLTLSRASQQSAALFGRSSPCYLPHNLYYEFRQSGFTPSIFQLFALSRISNYRLADWLRVFGFDIEAVPHLQIQIPARRTIV